MPHSRAAQWVSPRKTWGLGGRGAAEARRQAHWAGPFLLLKAEAYILSSNLLLESLLLCGSPGLFSLVKVRSWVFRIHAATAEVACDP